MSLISIWYIILAIFVFGVLIFIHEFGHFICARLCGVTIKEFAIGMGPQIISWNSKKHETKYSLRLLPIGGYVSMLGEDEASDSESAFNNKSVWKRLLIIIAGPMMNLILGFLVMIIMVTSVGTLYSTTVEYVGDAPAVSESFGIMDGDQIVKIGKTRVHTWYEVNYEITYQGSEPVDVTVKRNGEKLVVENVVFPTSQVDGMTFGRADFVPQTEDFNVISVIKHSFFRSLSTVKMIVDSFVDLLSGKYGLEAMSGPVGITQTIGDFASLGMYYFLYIFVVITINLGVFNLFPIPALDGGRLLFLIIEAIIGRPLDPKIEGYIHFGGLVIMLGLVLVVTFNDILRLF